MIGKESFERFWKENYNDIVPLGHILRESLFNDKWFRIHSLPISKRYADNEDEMKIILDRQNKLISDMIGEQNDYVMLLHAFSETPASENFSDFSHAITLDSIHLNKVLPDYYDGVELYLNLSIVVKTWKVRSLDNYLKAVANEEPIIDSGSCEIYSFLIIDINKNRIIAPYDGGVDIFLNTTQERDGFKSKYKNWLSSHKYGL